MKVLFTGGGTGGHIYPALEVAKKVIREGGRALYVGSDYGQEKALCFDVGIQCINLDTLPFYSLKCFSGWTARAKCLLAVSQAIKILKGYKPQSVFCTGGFSSAPVMMACKILKIPYYLYVLDSIPGQVLLKMTPKANKIFTAFKIDLPDFSHSIRVGMLVRDEIKKAYQKWEDRKGFKIIVIGGSQGARKINQVIQETVKNIAELDIEWVHLCGPKEYNDCLEKAKEYGIDQNKKYRLFKSLEGNELAQEYASCKLSICRSGASTIGEMSTLGVPGIFVPYPTAIADHQYHNAKEICDQGGGKIILQKDLNASHLTETIKGLYNDQKTLHTMAEKVKTWNPTTGLEKIYSEINIK